MSSVVRSVLGAALLLTGASAAMAASGTPQVADKSRQTAASPATVAPANAPVAANTTQTAASTAVAAPAPANAPVVEQARKPIPKVADNNDPYGGNDPNSSAGMRAFFVPQY
jgi:hypothetical protein